MANVDKLSQEQLDQRRAKKKLILKFVTNCLEKGPSGLRTEFQGMKRSNNFKVMTSFTANQPFGKNRYKDVGMLDANRVVLRLWHHDYIHANYVSTPVDKKRFILTQGPLESTCADFWWMCIQERVQNIVMLCNYKEKTINKCFEYLPTSDNPTLVFEEYAQKLDKDKKPVIDKSSEPLRIIVNWESTIMLEIGHAKIVKTVLSVHGPWDTSNQITHYRWLDWPDRGVPYNPPAIVQLHAMFRLDEVPIVVMSSAGIGRTGTFTMVCYFLDQYSIGQPIELANEALLKMRTERNNSVMTDQQYLIIHQVMMIYFRRLKLFDKGVEYAHKEFTEYLEKIICN